MSRHRFGLFFGLFLFALICLVPTPEGLTPQGKYVAAVTLLMASWWITEAIPIYATAFVPLLLFPLLGVLNAKQTAANFGEPMVLMFFCALIVAKAIESNHLHKRIALLIISWIGTSRRKIIFSTMLATAFLSMWLSNVAVALMMLPIGVALLKLSATENERGFSLALMLGIAYSASIGGVGTLVGTPPNIVFAGVLKNMFPDAPEISFAKWMLFGVPLVIVFLPVCWFYLTRFFNIEGELPGSEEAIKEELRSLGSMTTAEKRTAFVALLTVAGWVFRKDFEFGSVMIPGWATLTGLNDWVHDGTVAALGMLLVFMIPSGEPKKAGESVAPRLMDWKIAQTIPWGIVMIIGGGYCIASGFKVTGFTEWVGGQLSFIHVLPVIIIVLLVVLSLSFLTEVNSNTATSNIFVPVLGAMAIVGSLNPLLLMIPGTVACSCAFILPAATGPNSVIFASGRVDVPTMARCGFFLNLIGVAIVTLVMYLIAIPVFGIAMEVPLWAK